MGERPFNQEAYSETVRHLDEIMEMATVSLGMSEEAARDWLISFVGMHYIPVWRGIKRPPAQRDMAEGGR